MLNSLRHLFHYVLSSAIWVALGAVALGFQAYQLVGVDVNYAALIFLATATISSYHLHFLLAPLRSFASPLSVYLKQQFKRLLVLLCGAIACMAIWPQTGFSLWATGLTVLLSLLYSSALLPRVPLKLLNKLGLLKTILLAFTWLWATTYLPLGSVVIKSGAGFCLLAFRFCFLLLLCLIFDSRDAITDYVQGFRSMATWLPHRLVQQLQWVLVMLVLITSLMLSWELRSHALAIAFLVTTAAAAGLCKWPLQRRSYFYYYGWVDGMLIFCPICTYIALLF